VHAFITLLVILADNNGNEAIRDRIDKLEEHLEASKKKINQMRTATPSLKLVYLLTKFKQTQLIDFYRAPSLNTINRTYRNIDIAIDQQTQNVADLTSKMAQLNFTSTMNISSTRDKRWPETRARRNITRHVASTTAAALNAERSAQKLKQALMVRKEPLLNTSAGSGGGVSLDSMRQGRVKVTPLVDSDLYTTTSRPEMVDWSFGKFDTAKSPSSSVSLPTRRTTGGSGMKHHLKPISLRRGTGVSGRRSSTQSTSFDWGPLPSITPMTSISVDVRKKEEESDEKAFSTFT
jgi:nucleoporin NUP159